MKFFIFAASILFFSVGGHCASIPMPCGPDTRVRCVKYDPLDIVPITAMVGYHTTILFSRNEKIIDIGSGDIEGWDIAILDNGYGFFIKPKATQPATSITVVTNLRDYNFDFYVKQFKKAEKRTYKLQFLYPQDEEASNKVVAKEIYTEKLLENAVREKNKNEDYWVEGSQALTPSIAWDDGTFTYLRFPPNTDLPAVYYVSDDGTENKINRHVPEPHTIAIQLVAKKLVLRRNTLVTCIYNESYDKYGVENSSMTISPSVKRVVRKPAHSNGTHTVPEKPTSSSSISRLALNANPIVQEVIQANNNKAASAPPGSETTIDISKPDSKLILRQLSGR